MRVPRGDFEAQDLGNITNPVLIVIGQQDNLAGQGEGLTSAIGGEKLVSLPGCGHFSAVGNELYKRSVLDFLSEYSPLKR